jgi:alpha-tubulin suppressor-like RCC1 family protein
MVRYSSLTSTFLIAAVAACGDSGAPNPAAPEPGQAAELRILSGDEQLGVAGQPLPAPIVIQVLDSTGRPVPDQRLTFEADLGGGAVSPDTGATDARGMAQVEWTLGPDPTVPQRLLVNVVFEALGPTIYTWAHATGTAAPTGLHFRVVEAGGAQSCGLTPEGKTYCWGTESDGTIHLAPAAVADTLTFAILAAGLGHTCALTPGGAAYCWGENSRGQLGNGNKGRSNDPAAVRGGLVFRQIAAGEDHTCALTPGGQAYCWGGNHFAPFGGQLGDGTTTDRLTPTRVSGGHIFQTVATGASLSCGLTTDGFAYCWGAHIGTRTGSSDLTPVAVGGPAFASISAGANHACGLTEDGIAYCWGSNYVGQLGDGTLNDSRPPVAVAGGHTFSALDVGGYHTCGLTTGGALMCWGWDDQTIDSREFNGGTSINSVTPVAVPGAPVLAQLSNGLVHGCGVTAEQLAYCWLDNGFGQLGNGTEISSYQPVLVR